MILHITFCTGHEKGRQADPPATAAATTTTILLMQVLGMGNMAELVKRSSLKGPPGSREKPKMGTHGLPVANCNSCARSS